MMKKEVVWVIYALLIVILAVVGYYIGKRQGKEEVFASFGALTGAVISIIMWLTWGKKNTY